jgi:hypothetical protein
VTKKMNMSTLEDETKTLYLNVENEVTRTQSYIPEERIITEHLLFSNQQMHKHKLLYSFY